MNRKLNLPKLESYSSILAEKICSDFFNASKTLITGLEIVALTEIEQVNFFILKIFRISRDEAPEKNVP